MSTIVINPGAMQRLLASPTGPLARDLSRRAVRVTTQAKINASGRPGPRVRTGRLRSSITWQLAVDARGLHARIGTNVFYAGYVERGTDRARAFPYLVPALEAARV